MNEGAKDLGDKILRKTAEIEIWDRNCRNDLRVGN